MSVMYITLLPSILLYLFCLWIFRIAAVTTVISPARVKYPIVSDKIFSSNEKLC